MDKQEALQKAYEQYPELLQFTNENGWCSKFNDEEKPYMPEEVIDIEVFNGYEYYRPISLRGIENNNGWVKIQSELDLPDPENENNFYEMGYTVDESPFEKLRNVMDAKHLIDMWRVDQITHYREVKIDKHPIY